MRAVTNDTESDITLKLKNAYDKTIATYKIPSGGSLSLPLYADDERLTYNSQQVFIYAGSGDLALSECYIKYDFSKIDVKDLDYCLQNQTPPLQARAKEQLQSFIELINSNITLGFNKLKPPRYEELERDLLGFNKKKSAFRFVF